MYNVHKQISKRINSFAWSFVSSWASLTNCRTKNIATTHPTDAPLFWGMFWDVSWRSAGTWCPGPEKKKPDEKRGQAKRKSFGQCKIIKSKMNFIHVCKRERILISQNFHFHKQQKKTHTIKHIQPPPCPRPRWMSFSWRPSCFYWPEKRETSDFSWWTFLSK